MKANPVRSVTLLALLSAFASSAALAQEASAESTKDPRFAASEAVPSLTPTKAPGSMFDGDASGTPAQRAVTPGYTQAPTAAVPTGNPLRFSNGIFVYPSASMGLGHNDNITGVATNKESSSVLTLSPSVVAELKRAGDRYALSYSANYAKHFSSSRDDSLSHLLAFDAANQLTSRFATTWGVFHTRGVDARGSNDLTGATQDPSTWTSNGIKGSLSFGAQGAIGRIVLSGDTSQKRYSNNRATTRGSEVDISNLAAAFYYRVMPKTSALFEVRNTWSDYVLSTSDQDNRDTRVYVGLEWDATAKTSGAIRLGKAYKRFDNSVVRKDSDSGSWEASVNWAPLTYSTFTLGTSRGFSDSTGVGDYLVNTGVNLGWSHRWSDVLGTSVTLARLNADYGSTSSRKDQTDTLGLGVTRTLTRNFNVGLNWTHTRRDTSGVPAQNLDFKRNVTMLSVQGSL